MVEEFPENPLNARGENITFDLEEEDNASVSGVVAGGTIGNENGKKKPGSHRKYSAWCVYYFT